MCVSVHSSTLQMRSTAQADNKTASENVNVFMHSSTLAEAKPQLKPVEGSRYKDTVDRFARAPPSGTKYKRCRADGATFGSSMPAPAPAAPPSYTSKPVSLEHVRAFGHIPAIHPLLPSHRLVGWSRQARLAALDQPTFDRPSRSLSRCSKGLVHHALAVTLARLANAGSGPDF